jgi:tetratricopeptide (TPR) repeat protein
MSIRFRQSLKILPGLKLIVSKRGLGLNLGVRGAHVTVNTRGQLTRSVGIPGTGLSDVKRTNLKKWRLKNSSNYQAATEGVEGSQQIPKPLPTTFPSIFASKSEREFFKALVTHNLTGYEKLFTNPKLELVTKAIAIQLAIQDDSKMKDASKWLNDIWIKKSELKNNKLFKKYIEKIIVMVPIAPGITYQTYLNIDALGLIYVEVLQQIKQPKLAKSIIEGVGANQVTAISLAELEIQLGEYDDVLALTNDLQNKDDATAILLVFRGIALREQKHYSASREVLNQALKSKKRNIDILHKALFERSKTYSEEGKTSKARTDLEKILKTDSDYPGLKSALAKLK